MNLDLAPLLDPQTVAVVGASPRGNRGLTILQNLARFGSKARIYPLHPRVSEIAGLTAYHDFDQLPETCDFVAIALGADPSLDVLEAAIEHGARAALLIAGGFGEGGVGLARRDQLSRLIAESGLLLCGPNCYGILNVASGFAAYSGDLVEPFTPGRIALVMQSGALTHSLTDSSVGRGLGLSHLITTGNEIATTTADYVCALALDERVDVIGVFLEGLRNPDRFAAAVATARAHGKPVVALTVGRSELGQRAAIAHTGAVAGGGAAMSGFLRRIGVVSTADIDEFRETLLLFGAGLIPGEGGAALVTMSGGGAGLLGDIAEREELAIAPLRESTAAKIEAVLPEFATVANPLDVTGAAAERPELVSGAIDALRSDPGVGAVVLALNVAGASEGQQELYRGQARILADCCASAPGPPGVAISLVSGPVDAELVSILRGAGIPLLTGASPALAALSFWLSWHHQPTPPALVRQPCSAQPSGIADGLVAGYRALQLIADAGIATPSAYSASSVSEIADGWSQITAPVVLKIESPGLAHKSDIGGVEPGIASASALQQAAHQITARVAQRAPGLPIRGFLVQSQVSGPSVECLVGIVRDQQVGLVLSIAPGGLLAELGGPAATAPVPVSRDDIEYLIENSVLARLLAGYRGAPRADRTALVELICRFSTLAESLGPSLQAAELNPVMVLPDGEGAVAVDALIVTELPASGGDARGAHMLDRQRTVKPRPATPREHDERSS